MTWLERLKSPASRWLVYPLLVLVFAAGAGVGHFLAPPEPEVRTEFVQLQARQVKQQKAREVVRYVRVTVEPNGKRVEETSEREVTKTDTTKNESISTTALTSSRPSLKPWRLGVLVGASWQPPALPIAGPLVLGATFEARLGSSPIFLGGWGTTQAAGVSVTGEF